MTPRVPYSFSILGSPPRPSLYLIHPTAGPKRPAPGVVYDDTGVGLVPDVALDSARIVPLRLRLDQAWGTHFFDDS